MHISSSVRPVAMPSFRFRYSALCNSFLRPPFRFTEATTAPRPLRSVSLGLRFRCRILGHLNPLFREFCSLIHLTRQKRIYLYYHTNFHLSTLFSKFFEKFFIFLQMRYFIYFCFAFFTIETICTASTTNSKNLVHSLRMYKNIG